MPVEAQSTYALAVALAPVSLPLPTVANIVPVAAPPTVATIKRDLLAAAVELQRQAEDQAHVTKRTWAALQGTGFHRLTADLKRHQWNGPGAFFTLSFFGGVLAALAGLAAGDFSGSATTGWTVAGALAAVGVAISPVSGLMIATAARRQAAAETRMVEVADLAVPLKRFRDASGAEKARIASSLDGLRAQLDAARLLSPEARSELNAAVREGNAMRALHGDHIARISQLSALLAPSVDRGTVESVTRVMEQLSDVERPVVAQALLECVFADRVRVGMMPYDVRNHLHDMLSNATRGNSGESKEG